MTSEKLQSITTFSINPESLQKRNTEIKRHPEISYHILKSADVYTRLADYVLSHHERWDGKGISARAFGRRNPICSQNYYGCRCI